MSETENLSVTAASGSLAEKKQFDFADLVTIMERLRAPDGCPWDGEQTHDSLKRYLIEESYEVLEAIDLKNDAMLCEELGDVLLQVVFHAHIAESFSISDVISGVCRKMIHRHPHVFGDVTVHDSDEVLVNWEEIKRREKGITDCATNLKKVPANLPALMRAFKVQQKAAEVGFDWDDIAPVFDKVLEEVEEVKDALRQRTEAAGGTTKDKSGGDRTDDADIHTDDTDIRMDDTDDRMNAGSADDAVADEVGDLLFAAVNLARFAKVHPELALTAATEKFIRRFALMESLATQENRPLENMSLTELDQYWDRAKEQLNDKKK